MFVAVCALLFIEMRSIDRRKFLLSPSHTVTVEWELMNCSASPLPIGEQWAREGLHAPLLTYNVAYIIIHVLCTTYRLICIMQHDLLTYQLIWQTVLCTTYRLICIMQHTLLTYKLIWQNIWIIIYDHMRGRVDDLSFIEYLSQFFLSIEFHCSFSISYKILPDYFYYYCISIRMW